MDIQGAASEIAKIKGRLTQLDDDDKQVCTLVAFLFAALCEINPELRAPLIEIIDREIGPESGTSRPLRTLEAGLEQVRLRLNHMTD